MRKIFLLALFLSACSHSSPDHVGNGTNEEQQAAAETDQCLSNPELSKTWGDCNVKSAIFQSSAELAKCRQGSPAAKGTLNFELKVKADGTVRSAKAMNPGQNAKLVGCLVRNMKRLQFAPPPKGKEVKITVPYVLE